MADDKVFSNGHVNVWVVPRIAIVDLARIPADVVNSEGINISDAISWSDTTLPHATGSDDIDDRSIMDRGNATSRGANNYEASLTLFHPRDIHDPNSIYKKAWDLFSQTRHQYVLVVRTLQGVQHEKTPASPGEWYSAFYFMNSTYRNDTEGDDSIKYLVNFLAQGSVRVNGLFAGDSPNATIEPSELALAVGETGALRATAYGHRVSSVVDWRSNNTAVATVSSSGVVTARQTGTANITFRDPSTGESSQAVVTVA